MGSDRRKSTADVLAAASAMAGPPSSEIERVKSRTAELAELGLMTASLLHELRDPVFALRARLQLLQAGVGAGVDDPDALSQLHASVDDIDALLAFYGGLGRGRSAPLPVDVAVELRQARRVLIAGARRRGITLTVHIDAPSLLVTVRPITIKQVLMNLANNAMDAVAGFEDPRVRVWAGRDTVGGVLLGVDDNGGGWPQDEAELDALTDPWVTSKGPHGSGLGLYLTRQLLDEAGGRLVLDRSELGGAQAMARWPKA